MIITEEIRNGLNRLETQLFQDGSEAGMRDEILNDMREYLKDIDKLESDSKWPKVIQELTEALEHLEDTIDQYGNENARKLIDQFNSNVKTAIEKHDVKMAQDLDVQIRSIAWKVADEALGPAMEIGLIKGFDDGFEMHEWKSRNEARQLINEAKGIVNANRATKQNLRPIVGQLFALLPQAQQSIGGQQDDDLLVK